MLNYNAPTEGTKSSIDGANSDQMNTFMWLKKALLTARKEQYFMPLASTINMPKHFGKAVKVYEYVPLLDERNVNSQGIDAAGAVISPGSGNLYGSSKDVGTITAKLPALTENGGRVNRVSFTRLTREGSIHKFGFFHEFTQESLDFDSDDMLKDHLSRELLTGAMKVTEDVLQKDLLASAGVVLYAGAAVDDATVTGEETGTAPVVPASVVDYRILMRLDQVLTDNLTPKQTTVITGSRLIDTKTIPAGRIMFGGSEVMPMLKLMRDAFGNPAFIPVQHYADAGTTLPGEVGTLGDFPVVMVPEMQHWEAAGAAVVDNPGYRSAMKSGVEHYNVYPLLVVGDDSFSTIGFQTDGKSVKFDITTKMPGAATADRNDPYGETGFSSIKWYYGILVKRPERIAMIKCVAPI